MEAKTISRDDILNLGDGVKALAPLGRVPAASFRHDDLLSKNAAIRLQRSTYFYRAPFALLMADWLESTQNSRPVDHSNGHSAPWDDGLAKLADHTLVLVLGLEKPEGVEKDSGVVRLILAKSPHIAKDPVHTDPGFAAESAPFEDEDFRCVQPGDVEAARSKGEAMASLTAANIDQGAPWRGVELANEEIHLSKNGFVRKTQSPPVEVDRIEVGLGPEIIHITATLARDYGAGAALRPRGSP